MKRLLLFISTLLCANVLLAQTAFWIGNIEYEITSTSLAKVEVNDANASITIANIPETVSYDGTDYSVTSIGDWAFEDCTSLASVTIPNSVTSIGNDAFAYCRSLTSIDIPNSVTSIGEYAFRSVKHINYDGPVSFGSPWGAKYINGYVDGDFVYSDETKCVLNCYIGSDTFVTIPNSVTSIGDYAFEYCSSLTSVTIPNSVTSIGIGAFQNCSSLISVTIPNSVTYIGIAAFAYCDNLTSITIPNSVTYIGAGAFFDCRSLTSVDIPNNVTSIGEVSFCNCSSLISITIPNSVTTIGYQAFRDCSSLTSVTIPNSVTSIGWSAFEYCSSLTSVTCLAETAPSLGEAVFYDTPSTKVLNIPCGSDYSSWESATDWASVECIDVDLGNGLTYFPLTFAIISEEERTMKVSDCDESATVVEIPARVMYNGELYDVTSIGKSAFYGCSSLTSVNIPNSVTSIGSYAFSNCHDLTSVDIPNSITSIGKFALYFCTSLTSVTIPNSVTSIGDYAFYTCSSLTSVTIPNSVTSIGVFVFGYCSSLTSVTIPNSVTSIGDYAFRSCSSLTSVTIPNGVTSIGYEAFFGCSSLTSIDIPNSVTYIRDYAFKYCYDLTSVTIGNSITSIGQDAFYGCNNLTSVTCLAETAPSLGEAVFYDTPSTKVLNIPCGSDYSSWESATDWASVECTWDLGNGLTYFPLTFAIISEGERTMKVSSCDASATVVEIPARVMYNGELYDVISIGQQAFQYRSSLISVTIPNSVTSIEMLAFHGCKNLTSVILPNNATINSSAFYHSGGINIDGITYARSRFVYVGDYLFEYPGFIKFYLNGIGEINIIQSEVSVIDCDESKSGVLVIPANVEMEGGIYRVTSIGLGAFDQHDNLTSVIIPHGVTTIGNQAFFGCRNLTSVTIPNTVTSIGSEELLGSSLIGSQAFAYCESLTSITIPSSVTTIGNQAFYACDNLTSVTCLAETAPSLGESVFSSTPSTKVLNIPFGSDYSSWQGATTWSKTNYLIQEGETKELSNDFTINNKTGLINEGVLRIKQGGQLINQTETNVSGIFEIETPTLANNKWSFIGAPFNNYKLEAIKPGTKDISISLFDYTTGNWSNNFATIEDEVGAGEGFFAWSFAAESTVFTTYGDGAEGYNFENTPEYALNNGAVTVTKTLKTHAEGGNWMALANPYTFKLDVNEFLSEHGDIKGGVVYRFNGETWDDVQAGVINMTEGFFVNYETEGAHSVSFSKSHRYDGAKKAETKKDYMKLLVNDGERTTRLLFAQNDKAKQGDDLFDANKLFSPLEITEPYFVTDEVALVKEEVNTLPYTANLNIRNYQTKEVTISIDNIPEGVNVFLLDNGQDIKMNGGVEYTTTITEGENADRFQLLVKKQQRIERVKDNQITIKNNNRQITITSDITNLNIEVYNNLGQKVFATKDYNFTLDQVPAGSYVVKAFYERVNQSQKIIVE